MRNLPADNVQVDETWGYVYAKEKTCVAKGIGLTAGRLHVLCNRTRSKLIWLGTLATHVFSFAYT